MPTSKLVLAIVLNILVMPGAGQIMVKEKKRGYLFALLVAGLLIGATYHFTLFLKEELMAMQMTNDIMGMAKVMESNLWAKHDLTLRGYLFGLAALYIGSIVDLILIYIDRKTPVASS